MSADYELPRLSRPFWAPSPPPVISPSLMGPSLLRLEAASALASAAAEKMREAAEVVNIALDFVPVLGDVKGVLEAIAGVNMLGERLSPAERALALAGALPFGEFLRHADEAVEVGAAVLRHGDDVARVAHTAEGALAHSRGTGRMMGGLQTEVRIAEGGGARLHESNHRLSGETARTGGVRDIASARVDRSLMVQIDGTLLPPLEDAPRFNREAIRGADVGLPDYEVSHLWGPGFGDEARDGMMLAPRDVNQAFLNQGIESRLRELQAEAARRGGTIHVVARAEGHPLGTAPARGEDLLQHASYRFEVELPGEEPMRMGEVDIWVDAPTATGVAGRVSVDVTGGSSEFWSLK